MRYWWVNQNKTYRYEVPGGYLWSPKVCSDGGRHYFYDTMAEVAPGDQTAARPRRFRPGPTASVGRGCSSACLTSTRSGARTAATEN